MDDSRSVLARATLIFEAFDEQHQILRLSDLSTRTRLPRSTVHRAAEQMVRLRWLERGSDGYRLGLRIFEFAGLVPRLTRLRDRALPFMQDVYAASHELVHLGVLDRHEVVYVEKIGGHSSPEVPSRVGGRMPASCTGLGKAMLAFAEPRLVDELIAHGLPQRTTGTIANPDAFRAELDQILHAGVAYDRGEAEPGIVCVAAPLRGSGRAIGAISVTGPEGRLDVEKMTPVLLDAAAGIWRALFRPTGS